MKIIWCNGSHKIKQMNSSAWAPLKIKKTSRNRKTPDPNIRLYPMLSTSFCNNGLVSAGTKTWLLKLKRIHAEPSSGQTENDASDNLDCIWLMVMKRNPDLLLVFFFFFAAGSRSMNRNGESLHDEKATGNLRTRGAHRTTTETLIFQSSRPAVSAVEHEVQAPSPPGNWDGEVEDGTWY